MRSYSAVVLEFELAFFTDFVLGHLVGGNINDIIYCLTLQAVDTPDLVVKKMVFLYLTNYAKSNPDLAILCINTLLTDCRNEDPLIRGLALRHLSSLKLDSVAEYIHDPLQTALRDNSAYVRKTGVMGILKLHDMNPDMVRDSDLIDQLYNLLRDRDPQVVVVPLQFSHRTVKFDP
jgi:AP-4 complex subunit beta-1